MTTLLRRIAWPLAALTLTACTTAESILPDRRPDYRTSQVAEPLEIPPDLTASTLDDALVVPDISPRESANLSDYEGERNTTSGLPAITASVLQPAEDIRVQRDGARRWLRVQSAPTELWPRVRSFWTTGGFLLKVDDSRIGILETDWLENRADISDGPIRAVLKRYLDFAYAAPTRDKFRVRLEPVDSGTEVYLTHYGMEEVRTGRASETTLWQERPSDPELEAEMLNRLMVHLGAEQSRAEAELAKQGDEDAEPAGPRSRLVDTNDGYRALVIEENYDRSWRLVGLALDRGDYVVEDQNRSEGLYLIGRPAADQSSSGGFLSKLAFWRSNEPEQQTADSESERYRVRLAGRGTETLVVVQSDQGSPDNSPVAEQILQSVREVIQ